MNILENTDWGALLGKAIAVIAILVVTWIIATVVKWAAGKVSSKVPALQRAGGDGATIGATIGSIASLVVWLFGLIAVLGVLGLQQALAPIQSLLNGVMGFLPNLIGAAVVFVIGALLAKVVRQLIETALGAIPFDKWLSKASSTAGDVTGTGSGQTPPPPSGQPAAPTGYEQQGGGAATSIPKVIATVVYALIMIVVAIAALQILGIQSISGPATDMLNTIFTVIPQIIAAGIMLAIGVFIARFIADILEQVLNGVGLERSMAEMNVLPEGTRIVPALVKIAQVGIVLFFAVMAANLLKFPQITTILSEILELGGKIVFGAAIILAGLFIANLLARMLSGAAAQIIKYATIVLFVAMGLKYMGIANSIIELGFGALVVGGAAAAALAFGLGGRDAAARQLDKLQSKSGTQSGQGQDQPPQA